MSRVYKFEKVHLSNFILEKTDFSVQITESKDLQNLLDWWGWRTLRRLRKMALRESLAIILVLSFVNE